MSTFQQLPLYTVMAHYRPEPRSVPLSAILFLQPGIFDSCRLPGINLDIFSGSMRHRSGDSHPSILSDKAQTVQILSFCNSIQSLSCLCLLIFLNQRGSDKHYSRFQQSVWPTSDDPPINS
ncbi:hypothetical protein AAC387_Pa04g1649 [Persea americana]